MRFRTKTIVGVAVIEMVLLAVLVGSALSILRDSNETELTRRVQLGGQLLAVAAKDAVISQDLATLDSLVTEAMASSQIDYVRILDAGGAVLSERGDAKILSRPFNPDTRIDQVTDSIFDWSAPVLAGSILHGEVRLGISTDPLTVLLASARRWAAGIAGLEMLLVAVFSWLLGSFLARQLVALRKASDHFVAGDFEHRVPVQGNDELAETARAFNRLAQQLAESNELVRAENFKRLEAQQDAEKSANLLRESVSSIAQGFTIYDQNDRLVHCNEAYLRFYETSRDLIIPGSTFEEIVRRGAERGQYSEAIGNVDAWVKQRVAQHQAANGEVIEQRLADGRWLLIVEYRTPSGYIVGNRVDITDRRVAEAVIRDRTEQLNAIFELSPDGFLSFDANHRIKYASPAFTRMTGLRESDVLGIDETDFSARLANACLPNARFSGIAELRMTGKVGADGTALERRQTIELADAGKHVLQVGLRLSNAETVSQILYFRDITHETEVDRLKSEFLSHAAHELRTPMASIYGFTELLLTQEFDEAARADFLATIYRQSSLMISIINELLDLARIEARRGKDFTIATVDLGELLPEIVAGFKTPGDRPSPTTPPAGGQFQVRADRKKLTQAISNVISNAYKYSPGGGTVELELVKASVDKDGRPRIGIRITDQGIGMTPDQLAHVCERFYRADTSGKIPGTGLGMTIVKEIVELNGGRLEITSKVGVGTTVTVWLPEKTDPPIDRMEGHSQHASALFQTPAG